MFEMINVVHGINFQSREMELFEEIVLDYREDVDHVCEKLAHKLINADVDKISGYRIPLGNNIITVNLAGLALWLGKGKFATCVLQSRPELLFQMERSQEERFYSVLDVASYRVKKEFITTALDNSVYWAREALLEDKFSCVLNAYANASILYNKKSSFPNAEKDILEQFYQKSEKLALYAAESGNKGVLKIIGDARDRMSSYALGEGYPETLSNFLSNLNQLEDMFLRNYQASTSSWMDLNVLGAGAVITGGILIATALLSGTGNQINR
ncbi:MAG: hypothetical protein K0R73_1139 [Candidatus Midichloriaceae bacterium]|jgi:hypothetical protein|nr:hypothetical protein [Candidatus Midichloriaceae bacterium]